MAEIFFIASDERALDLVESLRVQSSRSLTFESDLAIAVKRLHKENPLFVFIQSRMDGVSCEEIATRARMLVDNEALRLILLEDEDVPPGFAPPGFDASLRLTLSTAQLTARVLQLISEQDFAQPNATPSSLILDDLPDFDIPNFDPTFEPHPAPQWPSEPPPLVFDADALKDPPEAKSKEITGSDEIVFFVAEPPPHQAPPRVEPESHEPPAKQAAAREDQPQREKERDTPRKSPYPRPDQIYRKAPELCGEPDGEDALSAGEAPVANRLTRPAFLVGISLLLACVLFWRFSSHQAEPPVAQKAPATDARQPLPAFISKVPVDAAYAAAHPGWERYHGETVQFRVFREGGRIRAIQVLPVGNAEIAESQVPTWFREAAGGEMPETGKVKEADGIKVETGKARGGAEVAIYRNAERRILGVVMQLPTAAR